MQLPDHPTTRTRLVVLITRVFLPFALGYFLSYFYRTVNAVLGPMLMVELGLTPSALGFLSGTFFLAFAVTQIPLGLALDRYGPRRTEGCMLFIAAVGALIFAWAEETWSLSVGRAVIGLGVSGCLLCAFKAFAIWFPTQRLPFINGCVLGVGALGALVASSPLQFALDMTSWRVIFVVLAVVTLLAALLILSVVPERQVKDTPTTFSEQVEGLLEVLTAPRFWLIAPLITAAHAAWFSHQALWLGPWLREVAGQTPRVAADSLSMGAVGMVSGFVAFGTIADRLSVKGVRTNTVAGCGTAAFVVVQLMIAFDTGVPPWSLCLLFGFFGGAISLFYAGLTQAFPIALSGRVTTTAALLAFFGGFTLSLTTGVILDVWPGPLGFQIAFGGAAGLQILGFAWAWAARHNAKPTFM